MDIKVYDPQINKSFYYDEDCIVLIALCAKDAEKRNLKWEDCKNDKEHFFRCYLSKTKIGENLYTTKTKAYIGYRSE